jgi:HEAT repeat protein
LAALENLVQMDDPNAMEAVNWIIRGEDKHTQLREVAIQAVSEAKRSAAIEALEVALNTGSKHIRCLAVAALGDLGDPRGAEALIIVLTSKDQHIDVRCSAVTALGRLGGTAPATALVRVLNDRTANEKIRETAPYSLAEPSIASREIVEVLRSAAIIADQPHGVRVGAASALARLADLYLLQRDLAGILVLQRHFKVDSLMRRENK